MDRKSNVELQEHMLWTYYGLRVGLAMIGFLLPIVLLAIDWLLIDNWTAPSISDYYHVMDAVSLFATRDLFVGGMVAAAACLYFYKGFSDKENAALNLAGAFAVLVALLPTGPTGWVAWLHKTSAVLFFMFIAYVSLFRSHDTLHLLRCPARAARYARRYLWIGVLMVVSPLAAVAVSYRSGGSTRVFWMETLAIWTFALYWTVKTLELRRSHAERQALDAELARTTGRADASEQIDLGKIDPVSAAILQRVLPAPGTARVVPVDHLTAAAGQ